MDLYFTEDGDLVRSASGDLAMTPTPWRDDLQQAYIRVMTDAGDYTLYPQMGATLSRLYGMPQSPDTGAYGEALISDALNREGRFVGRSYQVKSVPTGYQTIRFDVSIISGSREQVSFAVQQGLTLDT